MRFFQNCMIKRLHTKFRYVDELFEERSGKVLGGVQLSCGVLGRSLPNGGLPSPVPVPGPAPVSKGVEAYGQRAAVPAAHRCVGMARLTHQHQPRAMTPREAKGRRRRGRGAGTWL